jgi:hypothetical protein
LLIDGKQNEISTMWLLKLLTQLFAIFGLLFIGIYFINTEWSLKSMIAYWVFYLVANIAAVLWRMADSNYDVNKDLTVLERVYKKKK